MLEVTNRRATGNTDSTGIRDLHTAQDPQQRAFASSVAAHHTNAIAFADAKAHLIQNRVIPVRLGDCFNVDQVAGIWLNHVLIVPSCTNLPVVARFLGLRGTTNTLQERVPELAADASPVVPSLGNGISIPMDEVEIQRLLEFLRDDNPPAPCNESLVDWSGIRTRITMLPWAPAELAGTSSTALPIPDDGYRSEDVEYAALARAIATATGTFRIIEVGAGWAPWVVAGVRLAKKRGLQAFGIAVEADATKCSWAMQHALDNGVTPQLITGSPSEIAQQISEPHAADLLVVNAAGWHTTTTLQFPEIPDEDMGGAIWTLPGTDVDYRGAHLAHRDVPAIAISEIVTAARRGDYLIDLLHIDVQGVEFDLLEPSAGAVQDCTRLMAVGTHSRLSEGRLQEFFLSRGWGLLIDSPCKAHFTMTHPTLSGFTVQDGNQLWENPFVL